VTEARRLAALLEQAYFGERGRATGWHGPSIATILDRIEPGSTSGPIAAGRHTPLEIVLHIAFWDEVCRRRLHGETLKVTTGSPEDWPRAVAVGPTAWRRARARLRRAQIGLIETVSSLTPRDLRTKVPGWGWTNYLMIHGTLHHDLYHAGQIALARSRQRPWRAKD
jgi:hypothetical protein